MTTLRDVLISWQVLGALASEAASLRVRELEDRRTPAGPLLVGLDGQGYRHLLVPIGPGERMVEDRRSAGVQIREHLLEEESGKRRRFVDVVCLRPDLNELFAIVAAEMLDRLEADPDLPDRACRLVLERWRELLDSQGTGVPGLDRLIGVFGELWQLRELVRRHPAALDSWAGPRGARHDFVAPAVALEVKTTLARQGRFAEIHGHDQLEPPEGSRLYLAFVQLEQAPAGLSVADLAAATVDAGADRSVLNALLAAAGLNPAVLAATATMRFRVTTHRLYAVDGPFPRIVSASFVGGVLPPGVLRLTYRIDLSGEPPHPLTEWEADAVYRQLTVSV